MLWISSDCCLQMTICTLIKLIALPELLSLLLQVCHQRSPQRCRRCSRWIRGSLLLLLRHNCARQNQILLPHNAVLLERTHKKWSTNRWWLSPQNVQKVHWNLFLCYVENRNTIFTTHNNEKALFPSNILTQKKRVYLTRQECLCLFLDHSL